MSNFIPFTNDTKFAPIGDNELIDVYYLQSPLGLLAKIESKTNLNTSGVALVDFISGNIFHCGIYFKYRTPIACEYVLDVNATVFLEAVLPTISPVGQISWSNSDFVTITTPMPKSYWTNSTAITIITGAQFKLIRNWILNIYYPVNKYYILIDVRDESTNEVIHRASTCDSFCLATLKYINSINGELQFINQPMGNQISILTDTPNDIILLNINDSIDYNEILNYYIQLEKIVSEAIGLESTLTTASLIANLELLFEKLNELRMENAINYSYDENNQLQYYKIPNPVYYLSYVDIPILRNINVTNMYNETVNEPNYVNLNLNVDIEQQQDVMSSNKWVNTFTFAIVMLVLFVIFILLLLIYFYKNKLFYKKYNK